MLDLFRSVLRRRVANGHGWQDGAVFTVTIVAAFFIYGKETREFHDLPGRAQPCLSGAIKKIDCGAFHERRGHLARHCTFKNQVIQAVMIPRTCFVFIEISWTYCLMRFLRILRLRLINARFLR